MTELDLDQVGLAKLAGVTKGAVNQWKGSKPTSTMAPAPAYSIADKTNYSPRWLMLGEGNEKTGEETEDQKIVMLGRRSTDDHPAIAEMVSIMLHIDDPGRWILVGMARQLASQHQLNKQAASIIPMKEWRQRMLGAKS